jgi:hypothetical protein
MIVTDDVLIERLKNEDFPPIGVSYNSLGEEVYTSMNPTISQSDIVLAEALLGCTLPPFLKRIYLEVGNGGFGPGEGLAKLFTPAQEDPYAQETLSIVHTTLLFRKWGDWPEHLLFICSGGCTIYSCIDYSHLMNPIVKIDQAEQVCIEAPSLQVWLQNWLDGEVIA